MYPFLFFVFCLWTDYPLNGMSSFRWRVALHKYCAFSPCFSKSGAAQYLRPSDHRLQIQPRNSYGTASERVFHSVLMQQDTSEHYSPHILMACYLFVEIGTDIPGHFCVCLGRDGTQQGGERTPATIECWKVLFVLNLSPLQATLELKSNRGA